MNISIETLIIVAIREAINIYQGMWSIAKEGGDDAKQYYFYRCEANHGFASPDELEITELYVFGPNGLTNTQFKLIQDDALYLLKYALFQTVHLMDARSKHMPIFSADQNLGDLVARLAPELSIEQLQRLPEEIGFAASIDFKPNDEIGVNAAKLLLDRVHLH